MLSDEAMRQRSRNGWRMGLPFTVCGNGSLPEHTARIREWLPSIVRKFSIDVICDAGAGDLQWMRGMRWGVDYRPFDLFPRSAEVTHCDITTEALPDCDAILCRMCLNHLVDVVGDQRDETRIDMAIDQFRLSSPLLIATHFEGGGAQRTSQFSRLDLSSRLGEPLEKCPDGREPNCYLAIWSL